MMLLFRLDAGLVDDLFLFHVVTAQEFAELFRMRGDDLGACLITSFHYLLSAMM